MTGTRRFDLALVMPVYNEEACIAAVVQSWHDELCRLGLNFVMLVMNDGSRDGTAEQLAHFDGNGRIMVITKPNSGHGPTILQGYRQAAEIAEWVFQTDSDDEMSPLYFAQLWQRRNDYPALFGFRADRSQRRGRQLISAVSRLAVGLLFGAGITDVNTPYRLIRSDVLSRIAVAIPDDTFAPNILISGVIACSCLPVLNLPVPHEGRKSGTVSIVSWRLWRAAARSLLQTILFRFKGVKVTIP
jgi:glycosyltransferase involved in cell wall biosynthesis